MLYPEDPKLPQVFIRKRKSHLKTGLVEDRLGSTYLLLTKSLSNLVLGISNPVTKWHFYFHHIASVGLVVFT